MREKVLDTERLAARHRPQGHPVMHQNWGKLLFMHWPVKENLLRALIPRELQIDTFGDSAWLAITPFTMWNISAFPPLIPPIPGLSSMHELNVRTYVHLEGVPGVWFFSLDANSAAAVFAARTFFYLPYFNAEIELKQNGNRIDYELRREEDPGAGFRASWTIGNKLPQSQPGSREFFLTERYCLYTTKNGGLYRAQIHHEPWSLQEAELVDFDSDILAAAGITTPSQPPILHYAEELAVDIWLLQNLDV
ncbi:MAG: DUF2071 domain-containing protein [bacterium]